MTLSKNLRLGTLSQLSNAHEPAETSSLKVSNGFKLKNGTTVPDSFLVPMILRKTKQKQKQQTIKNQADTSELYACPSPHQDFTLEPTHTIEEKEI